MVAKSKLRPVPRSSRTWPRFNRLFARHGASSVDSPRPLRTTARLARFRGQVVVGPFRLTGLAKRGPTAVEGRGLVQGNRLQGLDEFERFSIGPLAVEIVGLVTHRVTQTSLHAVAVVIQHLFEGALVDNGLVALPTGPLLALEGLHGHRAEFDTLHRLPRLLLADQQANSMEPGGASGE